MRKYIICFLEFFASAPLRPISTTDDCNLRQEAELEYRSHLLGVNEFSTAFGIHTLFLMTFPSHVHLHWAFLSVRSFLDRPPIHSKLYSYPLEAMLPASFQLSVDFARGTGLGTFRWILTFLESFSEHLLKNLILFVHGDSELFDDVLWGQICALLTHNPILPTSIM
ncbi:hypothetical protein BDZ94DRAFT_864861 [Collybia nuda]|uniref:Uncharacterized protein n=1 Tax=Collybia nuda TaxID=64659 RepID=A0A9P5Y283_9AGAR|nr:hypothetical protein BDZ94DRAFT_864861 [Collybia nuda]